MPFCLKQRAIQLSIKVKSGTITKNSIAREFVIMVFSSKVFLFIFLPITLFLNALTPKRFRNYVLLIMSLLFYAYGEPALISLMLISIAMNYVFALLISISEKSKMKRTLLIVSVIMNIGLLIYYKYFNFFTTTMNAVFSWKLPTPSIILPIGISFYTFQTMSYVIDVYRQDVHVQNNPFKLGMYVSLFPQLIAGPIVRYADIEKEIDCRQTSIDDFTYGIIRFTIGLSKKVLLADIFAKCADDIFSLSALALTTDIAWLGAFAYCLQIYFDFSGYSDMAIGLGGMLGFHFMENFNYPYRSTSLTEFWRRWHISLSTWFRDYVYIPLGGNRKGNVYFNLFIVFILTGLWHGANYTFVIWGLWHGLFLIVERILKKKQIELKKIPVLIRYIITMLVVLLGFVVFRSDTLGYAMDYIKVLFGWVPMGFKPFNIAHFIDNRLILVFIVGILAATGVLNIAFKKTNNTPRASLKTNYIMMIGCAFLMILNILFVMNQGYSPFIYFRF